VQGFALHPKTLKEVLSMSGRKCKWKFIGKNWLRAVDVTGGVRYINFHYVTKVVWWRNEKGEECVFVGVVGDDYVMDFKAGNFPTQAELEKFLAASQTHSLGGVSAMTFKQALRLLSVIGRDTMAKVCVCQDEDIAAHIYYEGDYFTLTKFNKQELLTEPLGEPRKCECGAILHPPELHYHAKSIDEVINVIRHWFGRNISDVYLIVHERKHDWGDLVVDVHYHDYT
jgi:hypothetical protein